MRSQIELYIWSLPVRPGSLGDGRHCQNVGHRPRDTIGIDSTVLSPLRRVFRRSKTLALPVLQPSYQHPEWRRAVAIPTVRIDLDVHSAQRGSWGRDQGRIYLFVSSSAFQGRGLMMSLPNDTHGDILAYASDNAVRNSRRRKRWVSALT